MEEKKSGFGGAADYIYLFLFHCFHIQTYSYWHVAQVFDALLSVLTSVEASKFLHTLKKSQPQLCIQ